jgi:protein gp37
MNLQDPGITWTHVFGPRTGRTWNPVGGCFHKCGWKMPDGTTAHCYAKGVAENVAQSAYPQGFEHAYWHSEKLEEPRKLKRPAGIFLDSMADLMGHWVTDEQVNAVLNVCQQASWHIFFLLTKASPRLRRFTFPKNVWLLASAPPTFMNGYELSLMQQEAMLHNSLDVLAEKSDANVTGLSIEPLSRDVSPILQQHKLPDWIIIGAASRGREFYQPKPEWLLNTLSVLGDTPVFYKENIRPTVEALGLPWREEYPDYVHLMEYKA